MKHLRLVIIVLVVFLGGCTSDEEKFSEFLSNDYLPFHFPNEANRVGLDRSYLSKFSTFTEESLKGGFKGVRFPSNLAFPSAPKRKDGTPKTQAFENDSILVIQLDVGRLKNLCSNNSLASTVHELIDLEKLYSCKHVQYIKLIGEEKGKSKFAKREWVNIDLAKFPMLKFIECHGIIPNDIFNSIRNCEQIEEIFLADCFLSITDENSRKLIQEIDSFPIPKGEKLKKVHIYDTKVSSISKNILKCPLIEFVASVNRHIRDNYYTDNKVTDPVYRLRNDSIIEEMKGIEEIFKINSLQGIDIENYQVNYLPKEISALDHLRYWRMVNTRFRLEQDFSGGLDELEFVLFLNCSLDKVPEFITHSRQILDLSINYSGLTENQINLSKLKRLKYVNLSYSEFRTNVKLLLYKPYFICFQGCHMTSFPHIEVSPDDENQSRFLIDISRNPILESSIPKFIDGKYEYRLVPSTDNLTWNRNHFQYRGLHSHLSYVRYTLRRSIAEFMRVSEFEGDAYDWNNAEFK